MVSRQGDRIGLPSLCLRGPFEANKKADPGSNFPHKNQSRKKALLKSLKFLKVVRKVVYEKW